MNSTQEAYQLARLDLETQVTESYCFPEGPSYLDSDALIWSIDSKYIAMYDSKTARAILVAPDQNWASIVAEGFTPVAWLVSP